MGRTGRAAGAIIALAAAVLVSAARLDAQVTSPGPLSVAHSDWEGTGGCARCHELGRPGAVDTRCLACHEPLAGRIQARAGYHATRTSDCASCHREHRGSDVRLVSFDTSAFEHADVGHALEGAHGGLACEGCHNTLGVRDREVRLFKGRYGALTRTYLGLDPACAACHSSADPHAGQFEARACADCHDESVWGGASRFDHASSRYPLTGRHRPVGCAQCHATEVADGGPPETVRYRPVAFGDCSTCHRDAHRGRMGASCASCHSTAGWERIPRRSFEGDFDHAATAFPLSGLHAYAACESCHRARSPKDPEIRLTFAGGNLGSYPKPAFAACGSCHVDEHDGTFAETAFTAECASCHTTGGWAPSEFDAFMHDRTSFALEGVHRVVPCADCHAPELDAPFELRLGEQTCAGCHASDDPHAGQFAGEACESCHGTESFRTPDFDHERSRFSLEGEHAEVACADCHLPAPGPDGREVVRFKPLDTECRACHTSMDGEGRR